MVYVPMLILPKLSIAQMPSAVKNTKSAKLGLANGFGYCNFCRNGLGLSGMMSIDEIIFNHHSIYDKLSICDKLIDKNYLDN